MLILTLDDKTFDLSKMPDEVEDDIRFSVLDNNDTNNPDFYFIPLIFLESFNSPAMVLNIGGHEVTMPIDWSITVGDSQVGSELEVLPLTSLNDRGFEAFIFNPISSFKHEYAPIEIVNVYSDVKWYFPKMKNNQLLTVPLYEGESPHCAYFTKDISRQSEVIDYFKLL
jgi:hypothetical protein